MKKPLSYWLFKLRLEFHYIDTFGRDDKIKKEYDKQLANNQDFKILNQNTNYPFRYMIQFDNKKRCEIFLKKFMSYGVSKEFNYLTKKNKLFLNSSSVVYNTCALPLYPALKIGEIKLICDKINKFYEN